MSPYALAAMRFAFACVYTIAPLNLWAHPVGSVEPRNIWSSWTFDPWILLLIIAPALVYTRGTVRLWKSAGVGRGVRLGNAACFAAGTLTLTLALVSPLDALGSSLFAAHMTQHQLLMIVVPPFFLMSAPATAVFWSVQASRRRTMGRLLHRASRSLWWRSLSHPVVTWSLHAIAIWLWHAPTFYERTLFNEFVHAFQHFCFVATACLFWWSVIHPRGVGMRGRGVAILSLFTTAVHTSILAALLTFSSTHWYVAYAGSTRAWGLSPLEDQQLGGLIMWIPGGVAYTAAILVVAGALLRVSESRAHVRTNAEGDVATIR